MVHKFLISLVALASVLVLGAKVVSAQETCTTVYGGGTICGAHAPVETGLADINPAFWGFGLLIASGTAFYLAKRLRKT